MTLYLIGLGLSEPEDITLKGLNVAKKCEMVFLEGYTQELAFGPKELEKLLGKKVETASRSQIEEDVEWIVRKAKQEDVAVLVAGDPLAATTHIDLLLRAKKAKVKFEVVHNASILSAVGITGLQLYKFGRTTTLPKPQQGFEPESPYTAIVENKKAGLHSLVLLDIGMSVGEGVNELLKLELKLGKKAFTESALVVGCGRIGSKNVKIKYASAKSLLKENFGEGPQCIIVPGKLHFMEEEFLQQYV